MRHNPGVREPEAGTGESAGGQHHRRSGAAAHLPFALVLAITGGGLVRIVQYHWRQGAVLIGFALLVAAVLRVLMSDEQAGLLAIRRRGVDVLIYLLFGIAMTVISVTIAGGWLS
ncbi:DUF3017 domain-containing protein [Solihabitans fulvus]|uniref:DUF3017 domain-containing protein n=1 Tax=Solihabitans fulvus TaxID=1892852 RepID=A0A5B2XNY8_9PSEU|nr:DUF3017 domain-containing protein [Solihabitans fulvus]KAA2264621.1 DUF3017 domain-containing protein [Solihabitans fulvus]